MSIFIFAVTQKSGEKAILQGGLEGIPVAEVFHGTMKNTKDFSFRFLSAKACTAEMLVSVYSGGVQQQQQTSRLQSLLNNPSAERLFFVLAKHNNVTVAFLQLCRERRTYSRFRIRGLYTHQNFRNRSLATHLLQLACKCVFEFQEGMDFLSFILPNNFPSLAVHEHAGFSLAIMEGLQPERHLCLAWTRQGKNSINSKSHEY